MRCSVCNKRVARVSTESTQKLCNYCFSKQITEALGQEYFDDFSKEISVLGEDKRIHKFEIWHWPVKNYIIWYAQEYLEENFDSELGYEFSIKIPIEFEQKFAVEQLHNRILKGISYKSLSDYDEEEKKSHSVFPEGEKQFMLNETGVLRIENDENGMVMVVDGKRIEGKQFLNMLSEFNGMNLEWRVSEKYESTRVPLKYIISTRRLDKIWNRFQKILEPYVEEEGFVSYKKVTVLSEKIFDFICILEKLREHGNNKEAEELAGNIIMKLQELGTDDDFFPKNEIETIRDIMGW